MRVRESSVWWVALISLALLLWADPLAFAQQGDAKEKQVEALIAEHVKGQPAATEQALRALVAQTPGAQRWPALARLVLWLERSRPASHEEVARLLDELEKAPEPWAGWARARRSATPPTGKPQDPIVGLVYCWSQGDQKAGASVQRLGSLAVPEVLRQIESFGATTLRHATAFVARNADPGVVRAFTAMLESSDPVRQVAVADALAALPPSLAKPLVETVLRSHHPSLKLAALRAMAKSDEVGRVVGELEAVAREANDSQQSEIAALLSSERLATDPGARRLLEALALVSDACLQAWVDRHGPDDAAAAEALHDRLTTGERRTRMQSLVLERSLPWKAILLRATANGDQRIDALRCLEKHGMELPREAVIEAIRSAYDTDSLRQVLGILTRHPEIDAGAEVVARLVDDSDEVDSDMRSTAYAFARDQTPRALLPHTAWLLRRSQYAVDFVGVLVQHADARAIGDVVDFLRSLDLNTSFAPLTRIVWHRSDASNLSDVLRLVALPASVQSEGSRQLKVTAVRGALERWFGPEHVAATLVALGRVDYEVEQCLLDRMARVSTSAEHLATLRSLLRDNLAKLEPQPYPKVTQPLEQPLPARSRVHYLIRAIGSIQAADAIAVLEELLVHDDAQIASSAGATLLAAKAPDRRALARRILADDRASRLLVLLMAAPGWTEDAELRQLAAKRLADWPNGPEPEDLDDVHLFLATLPDAERRTLGVAILERGRAAPAWLAQQALVVLGDLADASLVPVLGLGLKHGSADVRQLALVRLGSTGSMEAVPHLLEGLKDIDPSVNQVAKETLERLSTYLGEKKKWEELFGVKPGDKK